MPALQVRDLPETIYRRLKEEADRDHRSLAQQAVVTLARGLRMETDPVDRRRRLLEEIDRGRKAIKGRKTTDPVRFVREDRER